MRSRMTSAASAVDLASRISFWISLSVWVLRCLALAVVSADYMRVAVSLAAASVLVAFTSMSGTV